MKKTCQTVKDRLINLPELIVFSSIFCVLFVAILIFLWNSKTQREEEKQAQKETIIDQSLKD